MVGDLEPAPGRGGGGHDLRGQDVEDGDQLADVVAVVPRRRDGIAELEGVGEAEVEPRGGRRDEEDLRRPRAVAGEAIADVEDLADRRGDASEATQEILRQQLGWLEPLAEEELPSR